MASGGEPVPEDTARRPTLGERAAALVALLALAAAVLLLLVGVVRHYLAVVLTLVGAGVFVTAGWYAVSRRGVVRSVSLVTMIVAVGMLAAGLVLENIGLLRVILLVVAAAASVV